MGRFGALAWLWIAFVAAGAQATPANLYGDPVSGFGFRASDVSAASGVGFLPDQAMFLTHAVADLTVTTPATITGVNNPSASFADPSTGSSVWTVTANDRAYHDLWLVIVGEAAGDPHGAAGDGFYAQPNVGLRIDDADPGLAFVRPAGFSGIAYLAIFLGDLAQGGTTGVPIQYAVAQALLDTAPPGSTINDFLFPQYQASFVEVARVPEPGTAALGIVVVAFGLATWARRRRETI